MLLMKPKLQPQNDLDKICVHPGDTCQGKQLEKLIIDAHLLI